MPKFMEPEDVAAFVEDVVALGLNICAIGHRHYVIDDSGVHHRKRDEVKHALRQLREHYGDSSEVKDHLVAHLHRIGRVVWI